MESVSMKVKALSFGNSNNHEKHQNNYNSIGNKKKKSENRQLTRKTIETESADVANINRNLSLKGSAEKSQTNQDKFTCVVLPQVREVQSPRETKKKNKSQFVRKITQINRSTQTPNEMSLSNISNMIESIDKSETNFTKMYKDEKNFLSNDNIRVRCPLPLNGLAESQIKAAYYVLRVMINCQSTDAIQNTATDKQLEYYQRLVSMDNIVNKTKSATKRHKNLKHEDKYVALDCEMVGAGRKGRIDLLARVSIVNTFGNVLLDKYVKPTKYVTDYRTPISGIRPQNILNGDDFHKVQKEVLRLLKGKILIGHSLHNDLAVLRIFHPKKKIRDTSTYKPLCHLASKGGTPSLKSLSKYILNRDIQIGEHNSVEDAQAVMSIYNSLSEDWERYINFK